MKIETRICINCGADKGLHKFDNMQCPKNGIEENRFNELSGKYFPQQWQNTFFEDSGVAKLNKAAPDMLRALQIGLQLLYDCKFNSNDNQIAEMEEAIKKATE